jgi:hypothetical protein
LLFVFCELSSYIILSSWAQFHTMCFHGLCSGRESAETSPLSVGPLSAACSVNMFFELDVCSAQYAQVRWLTARSLPTTQVGRPRQPLRGARLGSVMPYRGPYNQKFRKIAKFARSQCFFTSCREALLVKLVREEDRRRRWVGRRMISQTP